jgi:high-affinity iron transporter
MFAAALIVFRELIEAALIVTILMAATRGVPRRGFWISLGIAGGLACAGAVAALTNAISALFEGTGQEIVNAVILFTAVLLIGWHVVWMNAHGRHMAAEMRAAGHRIASGERHMSALALVVGLAVMREGSEVVLMLQGLWTTGATHALFGGVAIGAVAGLSLSFLMYLGFLALPVGRIFALTNGLLVLIASGMAARGANFLTQAGLLPSFGNTIWNTDGILSEQSIVGQLMSALIGYISRPSGIEVAFYALTTLLLIVLMRQAQRHVLKASVVASTFVVALLAASIGPAGAAEVLSPYVSREVEIEQQGYVAHDRNADANNAQNYMASVGISPTSSYRVEFEGEFAREPGPDQNLRYDSFNVENTLMLTEPGEYWLDTGLFYEMDFARSGPNNIIFGLLCAKEIGHFAETFNLLAHKDYGPGNTPMGYIYSNQLRYHYKEMLEPGFEIYGDTDGKNRLADQQLATGPGIFGKIPTFNGQALKYELAYLFGATPATADGAARWKLEYEFAF